MKRLDIIYLRFTLLAVSLVIVLLCLLWLPDMADWAATVNPEVAFLKYPVLLGILVTAVAFLWAVFQSWQLLGLSSRQALFSTGSLIRVTHIRYAGYFIALAYVGGILYLAVNRALGPGLVIVGVATAFLSLAVSALARWLGCLVDQAVSR
ncbi:MAG TPA: DUF2975 domain-containing protein [Bacillota bacterium]|nr:DUF2975 domain-containing protein [Bacillota bacterium]